MSGNTEKTPLLAEEPATRNLEAKGFLNRTPLLIAVQNGDTTQAIALINAGANVLAIDVNGDNLAHIAKINKRTETLEALKPILKAKNLWKALKKMKNDQGKTPKDIEQEATQPKQALPTPTTMLSPLRPTTGYLGRTDLLIAVAKGDTEQAKQLIMTGTDVTTVDSHDNNLIHLAKMNNHSGMLAVLEPLIKKNTWNKLLAGGNIRGEIAGTMACPPVSALFLANNPPSGSMAPKAEAGSSNNTPSPPLELPRQ